MPIIIDATLSEPPSSTACFRDVTLYCNCFIKKNVVIECDPDMKDIYWKWLRKRGAFDFVTDIKDPFSENDISIRPTKATIQVPQIDEITYRFVLARLQEYFPQTG